MFSQPVFEERSGTGYQTPVLHFRATDIPDRPLSPALAAFMEDTFGPFEGTELKPERDEQVSGRAQTVLRWLFLVCQNSGWPVFELGTFEPAADASAVSDLNGVFVLPTRVTTPMLPQRLLVALLEQGLAETPADADTLEARLRPLFDAFQAVGMKGSNQRVVVLELARRGVSMVELSNNIFQIGEGRDAAFIRGTFTQVNSELVKEIQSQKVETSDVLQREGVPSVVHRRVTTNDEALAAAEAIGYPVVLKPHNGTRGRGVVCDLPNATELQAALDRRAFDIWDGMVEKLVPGGYARITVLGNAILEVRHFPLSIITGDGQRTVRALLDEFLGTAYREEEGNILRALKKSVSFELSNTEFEFERMLANRGLTLDDVLAKGDEVKIAHKPSGRGGGVTQWVDPSALDPRYFVVLEQINQIIGEVPLGVDVLGFDPDTAEHAAVNEVNFAPEIYAFDHVIKAYVDCFLAQIDGSALR